MNEPVQASTPSPRSPLPAAQGEGPGVGSRQAGTEVWTRSSLTRRAREREPALGALVQRARARQAEASAAGALPAPMAMAQLWQAPLRAPFVYGDDSMIMVGVQQTFTPSSARKAGAEAAAGEAGMATAEEAALAREVDAAVALAAADYREATARAGMHASHRALLERTREISRARVTTGGGVIELTRLEREIATREVDEQQARGQAAQALAELNGRLGRAADEPLTLADEPLGSPSEPLAALQTRARERSPALGVSAATRRRDEARATEADRMRRSPMYTVGLNYGVMGPMAPSVHSWGATFSMTLPWLDAGARARHEARVSERDASRLDDASQRQRLDREVAAAQARALTSARTLIAIDARLLPAARRAVEATRAGQSSSGETTLPLEALHDLREVELTRLTEMAALERALVELTRLVGGPITLDPLPATPGGHDGH